MQWNAEASAKIPGVPEAFKKGSKVFDCFPVHESSKTTQSELALNRISEVLQKLPSPHLKYSSSLSGSRQRRAQQMAAVIVRTCMALPPSECNSLDSHNSVCLIAPRQVPRQ